LHNILRPRCPLRHLGRCVRKAPIDGGARATTKNAAQEILRRIRCRDEHGETHEIFTNASDYRDVVSCIRADIVAAATGIDATCNVATGGQSTADRRRDGE